MPPSNLQMWPKYVAQQTQMLNDLVLCSNNNSMKICAFMNSIGQGLEIHKHITLERGMDIMIHQIYIPFTNLDHCNKITHKHVM